MKRLKFAPIVLALLAVAGCVAPTGPVEVTRFHVADVAPLGKGTISVEPAPGSDGASLEWQTYSIAVMRQLVLAGYTEAAPGQGKQVAQLRLERATFKPSSGTSPVSVGMGGTTGTYGSGVGLGIGINLTPSPGEQVETRLGVTIRDRATDSVLWEGRASFTVRKSSPLADTALGAPKMAEALFKGFPGQSGETILVK
ncbi:DUF4136 domain-containing protein [Novosphingobium sp.]|uniref:DUF4136 domain-containing protein n=1 Tax=Novosphingobium sp. TaxID=1874826 RepID=UPI0035B02E69